MYIVYMYKLESKEGGREGGREERSVLEFSCTMHMYMYMYSVQVHVCVQYMLRCTIYMYMYMCVPFSYSCSFQLLRVGFDEDTGHHDVKNVIQKIVDLRNPTKITRGLKATPPMSPPTTDMSASLTASQFLSSTSKNRSDKSRGTHACTCTCIYTYTLYMINFVHVYGN